MTPLRLFVAVALFASLASGFWIPMRDGKKLATYVDDFGQKNAITVIDRSPYSALYYVADIFELFGGVALRQNLRGTQLSEGPFALWHKSADDMADTVKWANSTSHSWNSGRFFSMGASADGIAAMLAMPAGVKYEGLFIIFATGKAHSTVMPGGVWREALTDLWLQSTLGKAKAAPFIAEVKANESPASSFWDTLTLHADDYANNVRYPSVLWSGWYDIFLQGTLEAFYNFQHSTTQEWQNKTHLVVDPLGHCQDGSKYFPKHLIEGRAILPLLLALDMFKSVSLPAEHVKAITFYVMGADEDNAPGNHWTTADTWPTPSYVKYFMHSDGSLNTTAPATAMTNMTYTYDPKSPVPTVGGNNLELSCGPLDQRPVEAPKRSDVLTFTSPVLSEAVYATGALTATLYVSSDRNDTDFHVKITDVYPDGTSRLLQDAGVRMRWRLVATDPNPEPMTPGNVYEIVVHLLNTSYVWPAGHSIRVSVASANAPRFSVNPNNGLPLSVNGTMLVAKNTLHVGSTTPSHFTIPTVRSEQVPPFPVLMQSADEIVRWASQGDEELEAKIHKAHEMMKGNVRKMAQLPSMVVE